MSVLILLFIIFYSTLAYRRLDWAVMFLMAALPSYLVRSSVFGIPFTLLEVMIWAVFLVWFVNNRSAICFRIKCKLIGKAEGERISDYPFRSEIAIMLLISLVAVGIGGFTNAAFGIWKAYFFEPILLYIVVFNIAVKKQGEKRWEFFLYPLLISAFSVSVLALYQKITGQLIDNPLWADAATRRVVSFFGYPNAVGLLLAPLALIFTGWVKTQMNVEVKKAQILKKFFILLATCLSLLAIIFARSVGASIGVAAGLTLFGLAANKKSRIATLVILALAIIGIVSFTSARHKAYEYLTLNDFSGQVRKSQWDETWKMLNDKRLVFGAGLANYQKAVAPYHHEGIWIKDIYDPDWLTKQRTQPAFRQKAWQPLEIFLYPHDIFLNFWTELGLAGMLLFIWIIIKFYYLGVKALVARVGSNQDKYLILGLIAAMTAIVIHGLVDVPYFKNDLSAMFWIFIAMMGLASLENKTPQS